jgi:hypothetical protein
MPHSIEDLMRAKSAMTSRYLSPARPKFPASGTSQLDLVLAAAEPRANVHAVGVGYKLVANNPIGEMAVRFYVHRKLSLSLLDQNQRLPETIDGLPVDVIEALPAQFAAETYQGRERPVQGGTSVAHFKVTAGTIACVCRSSDPADDGNTLFVLSNNHVLANLNQSQVGDAVLQPGPADGGRPPDDMIGRLHRFVPISPAGNTVDCAIAQLDPAVSAIQAIFGIGAPTGVGDPVVGMTLRKQGRTTGQTAGTISDISIDATIGLEAGGQNTAVFHNQLRVDVGAASRYLALPGDSGSLFVDSENRAVGMLFACPADGTYALACRFTDVQNMLKVSLWM